MSDLAWVFVVATIVFAYYYHNRCFYPSFNLALPTSLQATCSTISNSRFVGTYGRYPGMEECITSTSPLFNRCTYL